MTRKIDRMHELFGISEQHKCKNCDHLIGGVNEYRKCEVYGNTRSEATDWALSWTACGLFNKESPHDMPIVKLQHSRKAQDELQCDGQLSLFTD